MFVQKIHKRIRHFVLHDLVQSPPAGPVNHEQDVYRTNSANGWRRKSCRENAKRVGDGMSNLALTISPRSFDAARGLALSRFGFEVILLFCVHTPKMLSPTGRTTLRRVVEFTQSTSVPDFLLPAFALSGSGRGFSSSSLCRSRIGSAPLSIPPEVNLRLLEPPPRRKAVTRIEPPQMVEVEGPLGKPGLHNSRHSD